MWRVNLRAQKRLSRTSQISKIWLFPADYFNIRYLAIIEWGWVGYEEFCRSRRVLSIEARRRPRLITPSEICRVLHILRKPNSIIALLFIQNIFFAQTCKLYSRPFPSLLNGTTLCPGFSVNGSIIFDVNDSITCSGLHFWRHWLNMTAFLVNSSCLWWIMHVILTN